MFIDKADITVRAGTGGDGAMSFRREKFIPKGGPNGGDGGQGGDVYLRANARLKTLRDFARKPKYEAQRGGPGRGRNMHGESAEHLILDVPCGTMVFKEGKLVADLLHHGDTYVAAKGGRGGRGNEHFKSSTRQAPRIAERGEPGESAQLHLELKILADVGFVGFPNAGKSTLLSRLTRANPKIANYPFTTLSPNLGVAVYHHREIILADIPGLIEGSHTGKGLGHEFLRHIERTRVIVHVVDPMGYGDKTPKEAIKIINAELKSHSPELAKKPQILVVNKQDLTGADQVLKDVKKAHKKLTVVGVSGVTGQGIEELLPIIGDALEALPAEEKTTLVEPPVHVKLEPDFWVEKHGDDFVVKGKKIERLVAMTNFILPEAVQRTQNIMKKLGVERALSHAGAQAGDLVRILDFEFTFEPDLSQQEATFQLRQMLEPKKH